jgi:hypothetical protein
MLNVCVLSGLVLTEPKLKFFEGDPITTFDLGINVGPLKAGVIRVCCPPKVAPIAESSISKGDRVAVVGFIGRYMYEEDTLKGPRDLIFLVQDFELVRRGPGSE